MTDQQNINVFNVSILMQSYGILEKDDFSMRNNHMKTYVPKY